MHTRIEYGMAGGCLLLAIAFFAAPAASAGERHAGTVLSVDSATGIVVLDEFGANAVRRTREIQLAANAQVVKSERNEPVTDWSQTFTNTPIGLEDVHRGDFVVVDVPDRDGPATEMIVTLRAHS